MTDSLKKADFPTDVDLSLCLGDLPFGHRFEPTDVIAVVAAWHARRPLLVRGEAGIGKSQLARAVAAQKGWDLVSTVITPGMGHEDLRWQVDAVARLAEAQLLGAVDKKPETAVRDLLHPGRFVRPGPIWRAFRPTSAALIEAKATGGSIESSRCAVLLIDEIDKADADLPNGLLDELDRGDIQLPPLPPKLAGIDLEGNADPRRPVLTIITSNDESPLPLAFERRCLALNMRLPSEDDPDLARRAADRVRAAARCDQSIRSGLAVLDKAVERWISERRQAGELERKPSVSELCDLLRVVGGIADASEQSPFEVLEEVSTLTLRKRHQS